MRALGWISIEHIQGEDRAVALCSISPNTSRRAARSLLLLPAIALLLVGCEQKTKAKTVEARPVRTITAAKIRGTVSEGMLCSEQELGIVFKPDHETLHSADVFKDLKLPREIAREPLLEGEWA